jgi:hypothetical protein
MPYDIFLSVLHSLNEVSQEPYLRKMLDGQRKRWHLPHPLGAVSLTNKYWRGVCLPFVFEAITVRGDPLHVIKRLGEVEQLSTTLQQYIKWVTACPGYFRLLYPTYLTIQDRFTSLQAFLPVTIMAFVLTYYSSLIS